MLITTYFEVIILCLIALMTFSVNKDTCRYIHDVIITAIIAFAAIMIGGFIA